MKNKLKLFGFITFVAVIGFSMAACDVDDSNVEDVNQTPVTGDYTFGNLNQTTGNLVVGPAGTGTNVKVVSTGGDFTAAIRTDGSLWAWGYNEYGELGDGTRTRRFSPVQISF